ncbi:FAD/NAD(P)-binding domain-containing protein [Meira miltonrushii]|uniref:FAD/NAD(P)-binding domain-containing protein n=1 Tax=Meira miltonrushii TaxID=1280837 RepID=A0A316V985_9BASI|nr:FAD/NAD(P)-binding domain-containing protein [Meira miltonrushii]PWN33598.1 FAD/NAD(P)-binding domain-containing protein [Meira miltonrushii]
MNRNESTADVDLDVVVIGAGVGGISAGYYIGQKLGYSYAIFEAREELGGTWSSFTYPGIRSDSEMFTLSFPFNPWNKTHSIATGDEILEYVKSTAEKFYIDKHIKYGHTATSLAWSSEEQRWTSTFIQSNGSMISVTSRFLMIATGFINHNKPHYPNLSAKNLFKGPIVHAQLWPEDLNYANKTIAVIGSGATAISMIPHLAKTAKLVTMVQRSPSYIKDRKKVDKRTEWIMNFLPLNFAAMVLFFIYELERSLFFFFCMIFPSLGRHELQKNVQKQLPHNIPFDQHFVPAYKPFDQPLCWTLENDLFISMKQGKTSVVTGTINQLTANGIEMDNGQFVQADIIIQATGFQCRFLGGMMITVDGKKVQIGDTFFYRGMMLDGVPNAIALFGFVHASWTIGINQACDYFYKLLIKMEKEGYQTVTPRAGPEIKKGIKPFPCTSGFIVRALHLIPKVSDGLVWRHHLDPVIDWLEVRLNKRYQSLDFE